MGTSVKNVKDAGAIQTGRLGVNTGRPKGQGRARWLVA